MAASSKFEMSSGSPDRPIYAQRGSYTAASLDRSASFRDSLDSPILSALPSMSRSSSSITQGDVLNFLQHLRFDPKSIAADHKFSRQVEFKRLVSVAFGLPVDDSPSSTSKGKPLPTPSIEELKRLKTCLRESSFKARERQRIFSEAFSSMNKCFPSIPSRKRSRSDVLSAERSSALFSSDRSVLGSSMGKVGTQTHAVASGFELEPQKSEERVKIGIPNKRTRTSMVDMRTDTRASTPARSSGNVDREREVLRLQNTSAAHGEERALSTGVESWEKSKMKKKRSGIKPDVSTSSVVTKPIDGYREGKLGMQPRLLADGRPRLNESHGFRPGVSSGAVGVGKADGTMQPISAGMRSSLPKADQDNSSLLHDRRDRPATVDKERVNLRVVNKTNTREDFSSPSPTSNGKMNSAARAPRSGSNVLHKLSPVVQRTTAANDWELSHGTSKNSAAVSSNNRKRTQTTRPSSPPVAWAGQRPQKISRTARRTNFVPIVSSNDESPALDATSDVTGMETGSGLARRLSSNSPQQVKSKGDHFSSNALSESEESGATETKFRDKGKKNEEMDEKASPNIQKVSTMPPRKNKLVNEDDHGDGVRRQGRSGRGFTSTRSLVPMTVEKLGSVGTAKQLRSARVGFEKTESKAGRPPTRKLSDRKPYTRQKHTTISIAADFHDDGHEELLAAAAAVTDPAQCFSSSFWRQMEPYFSFISDADMTYLKQPGNPGFTVPTSPVTAPPILDSCNTFANGFRLIESDRERKQMENVEVLPHHLVLASGEIPLCQRLIAALISEEGNEEFCYGRNEGLEFDVHGTGFELDKLDSYTLNHQFADSANLNCYGVTANGRSLIDLDHGLLDTNIIPISEKGLISNFEHLQNGSLSDRTIAPDVDSSEFQYGTMSLDKRVLLELQSVGLSPEPVPDLTQTGDEEISEDISRLEEKYFGQVTEKKAYFGVLLNAAPGMRELQEKEFENRALDKLVAMAYEKYMTCWGPNPSGGKNTSSKIAKQAALAFVKRTLERCQRFEDTSRSCFSEPFFRDMFVSGSARLKDELPVDSIVDGDSGKQYASFPLEVRVSAPTLQSPPLSNHDIYSSNALLPVNQLSEESIGKEDSWSNRVKKKELLLDDVGGTITPTSVPSGIGGSLSSSAKGKRSERDREGKVNREVLSRNGTTKIGRTTSGNIKGERKNKTKPKQKTTQLSASVNGLLNKLPDQPKATVSSHPDSSGMNKRGNIKENDEFLEDPFDLSHLQLPGMDVLGVPDDLEGQGQDIGSWLNLNIDDELPDHEGFEGLEIPMDDLSDLNMMV